MFPKCPGEDFSWEMTLGVLPFSLLWRPQVTTSSQEGNETWKQRFFLNLFNSQLWQKRTLLTSREGKRSWCLNACLTFPSQILLPWKNLAKLVSTITGQQVNAKRDPAKNKIQLEDNAQQKDWEISTKNRREKMRNQQNQFCKNFDCHCRIVGLPPTMLLKTSDLMKSA